VLESRARSGLRSKNAPSADGTIVTAAGIQYTYLGHGSYIVRTAARMSRMRLKENNQIEYFRKPSAKIYNTKEYSFRYAKWGVVYA